MPRASWNGKVLAESDRFEIVEGNVYFPPESLKREYFTPSSTMTVCPWKGTASYYTLVVDGRENKDAAWYYAAPKREASRIRGMVAFWRGVEVVR